MSERPRIKTIRYGAEGEGAPAGPRGPRPTAREASAGVDRNSTSAKQGVSMGNAIGDIISNTVNVMGRK